ncbi:MAG: hypothetical protein KJ725_05495 [Gammaproteobacteria bacterium]|nr:hypothetical protein [Gammaproteobacteria bacterium]
MLVFGFTEGESGDGTVSLASELRFEAQEEAARIYGMQEAHTEILNAPQTSALVNRLLRDMR